MKMILIGYINNIIFILLFLQKSNASDSINEDNTCSTDSCSEIEEQHYGVDVSWPMHHHEIKNRTGFNHRQSVYDTFLQGCYGLDSKDDCDGYEKFRIDMIRRQPQSVRNYTSMGFKKIKAPETLFKMIKDFWETNKNELSEEYFPKGDAVANRWLIPSYMVSVENETLSGGGPHLKKEIWDGAEDIISDWTGERLKTSSCYGIRVYKDGAILTSHVDRLPLVSSAIINVDQDVDEPWPLEVIGHDGRAYNVTMEPGDMVLYESHSIIHGRPFALKGRFYANIFIHFAPAKIESGIPSYIIEGSPEDIHMRQTNGYGKLLHLQDPDFKTTDAHTSAQQGNIKALTKIAEKEKELLFALDTNGWTPLHEAARNGNVEIIKFLLDHGADVAKMTFSGHNVLEIAYYSLDADHEAIEFLEDYVERNNIEITVDPTFVKESEVKEVDVDDLPAHHAAYASNLKELKKIAQKEKELFNYQDSNGWTPLHEAARKGNIDVIKFLLENGSDLHIKNSNGETALDIALDELPDGHEAIQYLEDAMPENAE